jgi:hypothetical protein
MGTADGIRCAGRVFVGIPVLNRCDLLRECVASIDLPAQVTIVNNNNVDAEFNAELLALSQSDSRLAIIDQPVNLGVAASWNLLLNRAFAEGYEWAFIASNDLVIGPGSLARAVEAAGTGNADIWHVWSWNCFLISRRAVRQAGWFDENFYPAYKEDQDYSRRCARAGVTQQNVPGTAARHSGSATIHSDEDYWLSNARTCSENHAYYLKKWGADAGDERFEQPFGDSRRDARWWPAPRDTLKARDWDASRPRIRCRGTVATTEDLFRRAASEPSDIREHVPLLYRYGSCVEHITEFGVRTGNSTAAFLHAGPERLIGYDVFRQPEVDLLEAAARQAGLIFRLMLEDIRRLADIEPTDLLFLDSVHTFEQVKFELRFARRVSRYIVLHDTETFGTVGEDGGAGIWPAVSAFLRQSPEWELHAHYRQENGLSILKRR